MVNFKDKSPDPKKAEEVLQDLHDHPEKITEDMFLELTDWVEKIDETLGYRLKERQGVIGGVLDSAGDDAKIVASFFRLYPLGKNPVVPQSSIAHIQHIIRDGINRIVGEYSQKYKNIVVATLPTPSWMHEK